MWHYYTKLYLKSVTDHLQEMWLSPKTREIFQSEWSDLVDKQENFIISSADQKVLQANWIKGVQMMQN